MKEKLDRKILADISRIHPKISKYKKVKRPKNDFILQSTRSSSDNAVNPVESIILQGSDYATSSYPDLDISTRLLNYSLEISKISERFNLDVRNNTKNFIGYINWIEAHKLLQSLGYSMPPINVFFAYWKKLKGDKVYAGNGKLVNGAILDGPRNEFFSEKSTRSEFLDALFRSVNKELFIFYDHRFVDGNLRANNSKRLERIIREDSSISLEHINQYGLPSKKGKDIEYIPPEKNSIAIFSFNAHMIGLDCSRKQNYRHESLGVRPVRIRR